MEEVSKLNPYIHRIYIRKHPKAVYETLASPEGWDAWFTSGTSILLDADGNKEIVFRWNKPDGSTLEDGGRIVASKKYDSFCFQWKPGESLVTVRFTLASYKDGTMVSVSEEGYSESQADISAMAACSAGWGEALILLKMFLEHGIVCKEDLIF